MLDRAQHDPATARKILAWFTIGTRDIEVFYRERPFAISVLGIPDEFLPGHRGTGLPDPGP